MKFIVNTMSQNMIVTVCALGANFWQSPHLLPVRATAAAAWGMGLSMWIYSGFSFRYSRWVLFFQLPVMYATIIWYLFPLWRHLQIFY